MKNKLWIVLLLAIFMVASIVGLVACSYQGDNDDDGNGGGNVTPPSQDDYEEELFAPVHVTFDGISVVSWTNVSQSDYCELNIDGTIVQVTGSSYDLRDSGVASSNRQYIVKLRAVKDNGEVTSNWTRNYYFKCTGVLDAPILKVQEGKIVWNKPEGAVQIAISLNGQNQRYNLDDQVTFQDVAEDEVIVMGKFIGDGTFFADSQSTSFIYIKSTGTVKTAPVTGIRVNGLMLSYMGMAGVDEYHLRDTSGNIIVTSSTAYNMAKKTLITSVRPYSSQYGLGDEVAVTYFTEGEGTEASPYVITTPEQFRYIEAYESLGISCYYQLGNDIEFAELNVDGEQFAFNIACMGSFSGHLEGNGYTIKNVTNHDANGALALFQSVGTNAVIQNIVFDNADLFTWGMMSGDNITHDRGGHVAIITNINRGTIDNVTVKNSTLTAKRDGAAAIAINNQGTITNCTIDDATVISGVNEVAGVVIYNQGTVTNCTNNAVVNGVTSVGGIVGRNAGKVENCQNFANITGGQYVGGVVGFNYNVNFVGVNEYVTTIKYCSNHGNVVGMGATGGIVGQNGTDGSSEMHVDAVAGALVYACYNTGDVTATGGTLAPVVGGIVGVNFASKSADTGVIGCYTTGNVSAQQSQNKRIYIDASTIGWLKVDGAKIYAYLWNGTKDSNALPGVELKTITELGKTYMYVDLDQDYQKLQISRVSPEGIIWNWTGDISITGNVLVLSDIKEGSHQGYWQGGASFVGALAGTSSQMNGCFAVTGSNNVLSNANGKNQTNSLVSCAFKTVEEMATQGFVDALNSACGENAWTLSADNKAVLAVEENN